MTILPHEILKVGDDNITSWNSEGGWWQCYLMKYLNVDDDNVTWWNFWKWMMTIKLYENSEGQWQLPYESFEGGQWQCYLMNTLKEDNDNVTRWTLWRKTMTLLPDEIFASGTRTRAGGECCVLHRGTHWRGEALLKQTSQWVSTTHT